MASYSDGMNEITRGIEAVRISESLGVKIFSWNVAPGYFTNPTVVDGANTRVTIRTEETKVLFHRTLNSIEADLVLLQEPKWSNSTIIADRTNNLKPKYESGGSGIRSGTYEVAILYNPAVIQPYDDVNIKASWLQHMHAIVAELTLKASTPKERELLIASCLHQRATAFGAVVVKNQSDTFICISFHMPKQSYQQNSLIVEQLIIKAELLVHHYKRPVIIGTDWNLPVEDIGRIIEARRNHVDNTKHKLKFMHMCQKSKWDSVVCIMPGMQRVTLCEYDLFEALKTSGYPEETMNKIKLAYPQHRPIVVHLNIPFVGTRVSGDVGDFILPIILLFGICLYTSIISRT